jgi:hypothetical protein
MPLTLAGVAGKHLPLELGKLGRLRLEDKPVEADKKPKTMKWGVRREEFCC